MERAEIVKHGEGKNDLTERINTHMSRQYFESLGEMLEEPCIERGRLRPLSKSEVS